MKTSNLRAISLVTIIASLFGSTLLTFLEVSQWGWDFRVYRSAADALFLGANPYQTPPGELPYFYSPIFLKAYSFIPDDWPRVALVTFCLAMIALALAVTLFGTCALFLAAFSGLHIAIFSGNFAAFEFILLCFACVCAYKGRHLVAGLLLSVPIAAKLTPVLFLPALALWLDRRSCIRAACGLLLGSLFFLLMNICYWPELSREWVAALLFPPANVRAVLEFSSGPLELLHALSLFPELSSSTLRGLALTNFFATFSLLLYPKSRQVLQRYRLWVLTLAYLLLPRHADYAGFYAGAIIAAHLATYRHSERVEWLLSILGFALAALFLSIKRELLLIPLSQTSIVIVSSILSGLWLLTIGICGVIALLRSTELEPQSLIHHP